jgi:hypothetical protein
MRISRMLARLTAASGTALSMPFEPTLATLEFLRKQ